MARFNWTNEAMAEVSFRSRIGFTYAEIGAYLGTTKNAIQRMVARTKIISKEERSALRSERLTGQKRSKADRAKRSANMKAAWADPAIRAARIERRRQVCQRPEVKAKLHEAGLAAARKRRGGYDLPDEKAVEDYRLLTKSKRIPAAEAGRMLGLIPATSTNERRA